MTAKKHDFTRVEIKAGIFLLISLLVFLLFAAAIYGLRPPSRVKHFFSDFKDTKGLNKGADVRFGGMKVGKVEDIGPCPEDRSLIRVSYTVEPWVPVNLESTASIGAVSLVADMHLEISTGSPQAPLLPDGSLVPSTSTSSGPFAPLELIGKKVEEALSEKGIVGDLRKILGTKPGGQAKKTELVSIAQVLSKADKALERVMKLVEGLVKTFEENRESFGEIVEETKKLERDAREVLGHVDEVVIENKGNLSRAILEARKGSEKFRSLAERLEQSSARLEKLLMAGEITIQKVQPLLEDLRRVLEDFRAFARTISENPSSLFFGASPQGRP